MLEIYVVWHPQDEEGAAVAREILEHFHGTAFSGLIGGAIEVFARSAPWDGSGRPPRPLPFMQPFPHGIAHARLTAVVPVASTALALELEREGDAWREYIAAIVAAAQDGTGDVAVLPVEVDRGALTGTRLGELLGDFQLAGIPNRDLGEQSRDVRIRDLTQALAQFAGPPGSRIRVFVSHTKHAAGGDRDRVHALIAEVRRLISATRLDEFFDASDLQPGSLWENALSENASSSALLAVRTDLYASRRWCQTEMALAKKAGMPVVILDALRDGEERGSFLMDHVPRVPGGQDPDASAIMKALGQLVDECLKRALWTRQEELAKGRDELAHAWWAPHAPEPVTFADWLAANADQLSGEDPVRVLHPDPPLGTDEIAVLEQIASLAGLGARLEVMTPRSLAARGG